MTSPLCFKEGVPLNLPRRRDLRHSLLSSRPTVREWRDLTRLMQGLIPRLRSG